MLYENYTHTNMCNMLTTANKRYKCNLFTQFLLLSFTTCLPSFKKIYEVCCIAPAVSRFWLFIALRINHPYVEGGKTCLKHTIRKAVKMCKTCL